MLFSHTVHVQISCLLFDPQVTKVPYSACHIPTDPGSCPEITWGQGECHEMILLDTGLLWLRLSLASAVVLLLLYCLDYKSWLGFDPHAGYIRSLKHYSLGIFRIKILTLLITV